MTLKGARPQNEEAPTAGHGNGRSGTSRLMEEVVERDNLKAALKRVRQKKGSPGIHEGQLFSRHRFAVYRPV